MRCKKCLTLIPPGKKHYICPSCGADLPDMSVHTEEEYPNLIRLSTGYKVLAYICIVLGLIGIVTGI
jgi:hypothetical protein